MKRLLALLLLATPVLAQDPASLRDQVLALGQLTEAPAVHPAEGFAEADGIKALFYEALPWKGKPTRVFALLGIPETKEKGSLPGVVLVHGGGGSAFRDWVKRWKDEGYAALSIAVEGQTEVRDPGTRAWTRHEHGGPARSGIYGDSDEPLTDQWIFHAVADTILANSLLKSLPEVDGEKVGLMGISWGGVITSTVIGIDPRFAFAIPTYGCGNLADAPNQYGRALGKNTLYREVWDPIVRLEKAAMPVLWLSWTGDQHFPLDLQAGCYGKQKGPHLVSLIPNMRHGHAPGWNPPDSYAFADSVIERGETWCEQTGIMVEGKTARIRFRTSKGIDSAVLTSTSDSGATGARSWKDSPARIRRLGEATVVVNAILPEGTTGWFVNLKSGALHASSDFQVIR